MAYHIPKAFHICFLTVVCRVVLLTKLAKHFVFLIIISPIIFHQCTAVSQKFSCANYSCSASLRTSHPLPPRIVLMIAHDEYYTWPPTYLIAMEKKKITTFAKVGNICCYEEHVMLRNICFYVVITIAVINLLCALRFCNLKLQLLRDRLYLSTVYYPENNRKSHSACGS